MTRPTRIASAAALAAALALTAACNRDAAPAADGNTQAQFALPELPATLPLAAGEATAVDPAPAVSDLPDAAPVKLARVADPRQAYGYADAAYTYDEALGDAPPDYGFDYDGTDPWAWQGYDDSLMVAEPIDAGYRYYYYRPGAEQPYFVRDPYYSYGFADGLLAVIYGADGGIVPYADYGPRLGYASRYYARGRQLWGASRRSTRRPVIAANWVRGRPAVLASRERWGAGRARQPGWQAFHASRRDREAGYWRTERLRREADARRFAGWRDTGFRAAPPPRAIPVRWQEAKWARDDRRYRPAAEALRERRDDRAQARRDDAGAERRDAERRQNEADRPRRQQADAGRDAGRERREQVVAERRARQQAQAADRRDAARTDSERRRAEQTGRRDAAQAERQRAQAERRQAQQGQVRQAEQARRREAAQAERQRAQAERRQTQQGQARQAEQARRREAAQADRQRQQAERRQGQQAEQAQRRQAERQQAQAQRRQAQQAERRQAADAQRAQARQAQREQQQAQRQQAAQAQREQARQAQRQQQQAQRQQQQQAQRQQQKQAQHQQAQQQQRQEQRAARREGRGPGQD